MKAGLCAILVLLMGCATMGDNRLTARGDSSATDRTCSMQTFYEDGTEQSCENMREKTVVGGQGGTKLYEFLGVGIGLVSIAIQALR